MTKKEYQAMLADIIEKFPSEETPHPAKGMCEYIASLEADNAKLNRALDVSARKMYDCAGSCPNDVYGWRHPRTCGIRCKELEQPDGWVHCWREYALAEASKGEGK